LVGLSIKDPIREKQLFANRAIALFFCIVVMFGLLVTRFVQLQVWEFETYQTRSDSNRIQVQPLAPPRGLIFDRHGELLADNRVSSSLTLVTERIDQLAGTIAHLARLVSVTPADISEFELRLRRKRRPFEPVALRLTLSEEEVALLAVNRQYLPVSR
jgi:penicillin-binding protein 2